MYHYHNTTNYPITFTKLQPQDLWRDVSVVTALDLRMMTTLLGLLRLTYHGPQRVENR